MRNFFLTIALTFLLAGMGGEAWAADQEVVPAENVRTIVPTDAVLPELREFTLKKKGFEWELENKDGERIPLPKHTEIFDCFDRKISGTLPPEFENEPVIVVFFSIEEGKEYYEKNLFPAKSVHLQCR
jgi:hypothetical protein